jgi:hypothetical protein
VTTKKTALVSRRRPLLLLLAALSATLLGSPPARGVDDPVAAAEAAWEEEMRQLAEEGDEEAALELGRIAVDRGDTQGARTWLERAKALGAEVPPDLEQAASSTRPAPRSGGGWGSGSVERRAVGSPIEPRGSSDPCDRPGVDLDLALRRADLALSNQDLERWIDAIVPIVRAGCRSPALVERIEKARATEASLEAARDREIASAVRQGRPTVGTQVGRSLDPSSSRAGAWSEVADGLIAILQDRQDSRRRSASPPDAPRIPANADQATRNAYAGIWADTQDQISHDPEDDYWARVAERTGVKAAITQRGETEPLPAPPAPPVATGDPGGLLAGSSGAGGACAGLYTAAEATCDGMFGKRPGSVCQCCPGIYGLDHCSWSEGTAPAAATHKVCEVDTSFYYFCPVGSNGMAWITKTAKESNNLDSGAFYKDAADLTNRRGVRDVRLTYTIDFQCGAKPANAVAGPIDVSKIEVGRKQEAVLRPAVVRAQKACCVEINASHYDSDYRCSHIGF